MGVSAVSRKETVSVRDFTNLNSVFRYLLTVTEGRGEKVEYLSDYLRDPTPLSEC